MSKYRTIPNCSKFDFCNDDRYKAIMLSLNCSQAFIAQSDFLFRRPLSFLFFVHSNALLYYYELFITLLENFNKSRTSAGRLCGQFVFGLLQHIPMSKRLLIFGRIRGQFMADLNCLNLVRRHSVTTSPNVSCMRPKAANKLQANKTNGP
jgi:hypothetical protein